MWPIIFVLPNLRLSEPVGNQYIAIAPHNDDRVKRITKENRYAKALVENFEGQFGTIFYPAILIVNNAYIEAIPDKKIDIELLVAFRNLFAMSTIIKGHKESLKENNTRYPLFSDYFDFYPITISRDADDFITASPALLGIGNKYQAFKGQTSPGLPQNLEFRIRPSEYLFSLLEKLWRRRFISGRKEWASRALFRSLEMAYQASAMPYKNYGTIYDYGSSASLWVSAFEVLSHPRKGKAGLSAVFNLIDRYNWDDNRLNRRPYTITINRNSYKITLVQKLYKELYDTRNQFLHGNPVGWNRLRPFSKKTGPAITVFAPLIYEVALWSFLDRYEDKRMSWRRRYITKLNNERDYYEAIEKAKIGK